MLAASSFLILFSYLLSILKQATVFLQCTFPVFSASCWSSSWFVTLSGDVRLEFCRHQKVVVPEEDDDDDRVVGWELWVGVSRCLCPVAVSTWASCVYCRHHSPVRLFFVSLPCYVTLPSVRSVVVAVGEIF